MSSDECNFQPTDHLGSPIETPTTPSSPPSTGAVELSFQTNESIGQNSPPHNYRHSRAYRHFKNPPQPHMCIRVTTVAGEELFINVLSWTRIVIPQEPSDPIPLYGGMRVPPGSPRSPPLVYAVMANPEVLKDSGRHSKDPEERRAMVELMCDFVEAMNPDVKLTRNAVILKDRDISGELKDVWNAVQAQRDREREEEFARKHGLPSPDSIFYKGALRELQDRLQKQQQQQPQPQLQPTHNSNRTEDNKVMYMEFGPESAPNYGKEDGQMIQSMQYVENISTDNCPSSIAGAQSAIKDAENYTISNDQNLSEIKDSESNDMTDSKPLNLIDQQQQQQQYPNNLGNSLAQISNSPTNPVTTEPTVITPIFQKVGNNLTTTTVSTTASNTTPLTTTSTSTTTTTATITAAATTTTAAVAATITTTTTATTTVATTATIITPTTAPPTKKEKLGGFLPNGCHSIFPRFKNHKNKEKDKEKDKEKESNKSSGHSKEKTLLNTFKKSTAAAANVLSKAAQPQDDSKTQFEKNCLSLNSEMDKLDINKLDSSDMLIKLKVASSGAK